MGIGGAPRPLEGFMSLTCRLRMGERIVIGSWREAANESRGRSRQRPAHDRLELAVDGERELAQLDLAG